MAPFQGTCYPKEIYSSLALGVHCPLDLERGVSWDKKAARQTGMGLARDNRRA